jgi:hypothetical protein
MSKKASLSLLLLLLFAPVVLHAQESFMSKLIPFQGKSFEGKAIFPEGDKNPFAGKALRIIFEHCSDSLVRIPFHVGEDQSRTWVLSLHPDGLLLKHDHRHADGTPDDITMYGGHASTPSGALSQHFPADAHTAQLIPAAATNEWRLILSENGLTLSYQLYRDGRMCFHADFYLTE